jgi:hypothetical protein
MTFPLPSFSPLLRLSFPVPIPRSGFQVHYDCLFPTSNIYRRPKHFIAVHDYYDGGNNDNDNNNNNNNSDSFACFVWACISVTLTQKEGRRFRALKNRVLMKSWI